MLLITLAAIVVFLVAVGAGMAARRLTVLGAGYSAALLAMCLCPWFLHHRLVVATATQWLSQESGYSAAMPLEPLVLGPALLMAICTLVLLLPRSLRVLVALLPAASLVITFGVTFPLLNAEMPDGRFPFDNVPSIWLGLWTLFGATTMILIAHFPPLWSRMTVRG